MCYRRRAPMKGCVEAQYIRRFRQCMHRGVDQIELSAQVQGLDINELFEVTHDPIVGEHRCLEGGSTEDDSMPDGIDRTLNLRQHAGQRFGGVTARGERLRAQFLNRFPGAIHCIFQ